MKSMLVTGANGFIGRALCEEEIRQGYSVHALVRSSEKYVVDGCKMTNVANLTRTTDYTEMLVGVNIVIHLAARVHIMNDDASNPSAEFYEANTAITLNLARQAAFSGVKRFVFLSSIKVNGESTSSELRFTPDDDFIPTDPYALSKYKAEQGLLAIAKETGLEVVIIRPPLVYGPGVKANFSSMMKWIYRGVPLPLGAVQNQRSFVALDNLVSFIIHCVEHPKAANEVFLISDNEDVSTTELLQKVAIAFEKRPLLIPIPVRIMRILANLVGKDGVAKRLFSSLQVDSSKARNLLDWKPTITMDEQLIKTADAYINEKTL